MNKDAIIMYVCVTIYSPKNLPSFPSYLKAFWLFPSYDKLKTVRARFKHIKQLRITPYWS